MATFNNSDFENKPKYKALFLERINQKQPFLLGKCGEDGSVYLKKISESELTNQLLTTTGTTINLSKFYKGQFNTKIENKGNSIEALVAIGIAAKLKYGSVDTKNYKFVWKKVLDDKSVVKNKNREYSSASWNSVNLSLKIDLPKKSLDDISFQDVVFHEMKKEVEQIINFCNTKHIDVEGKATVVCDGLSNMANQKSDIQVSGISNSLALSIKYGSSNKQIGQKNSAHKLEVQQAFWKELGINIPTIQDQTDIVKYCFEYVDNNHKFDMNVLAPFILNSLQGKEDLYMLHIKQNSWSYLNPSLLKEVKMDISTSLAETKHPKLIIWGHQNGLKRPLLSIRYKQEQSGKRTNLIEKEELLEEITKVV